MEESKEHLEQEMRNRERDAKMERGEQSRAGQNPGADNSFQRGEQFGLDDHPSSRGDEKRMSRPKIQTPPAG